MEQTNQPGQQSGANQQQADQTANKNNTPTNADKQVQQGGYSSKPEQQQTQQEEENMHSERDLNTLQEGKGGQQPNQQPAQPQKPGLPRKQ